MPLNESAGSLSCTAEYGLPAIELLTNSTTDGSNWNRKLTTPAFAVCCRRTATSNSDWATTGPAGPRAYMKLPLEVQLADASPAQKSLCHNGTGLNVTGAVYDTLSATSTSEPFVLRVEKSCWVSVNVHVWKLLALCVAPHDVTVELLPTPSRRSRVETGATFGRKSSSSSMYTTRIVRYLDALELDCSWSV